MSTSPRKRSAVAFLASQCRAATLRTGTRLPPLRVLARRAGVSLVTMQQTVAWCKQHNYVDRSHRLVRSLVIDDEEIQRAFFEARQGRPKVRRLWQRTADRMRKDLMEGVFRPGERLPSIKELCARYGVSYPTIRRILDQCVHEHLLSEIHGHLSVRPLATPRDSLRLALLIRGFDNGSMVAGTLDTEFIRCMEMECRKAQLGLDIIIFPELPHDLQFRQCGSGEPLRIGNLENMLGFVYVVNGRESKRDDLFSLCAAMRAKVAIQDHMGISPLPRSIRKSPRCTVFSSSVSTTAGRAVGDYLRDRGHRHVAFISPFHGDQVWSHQRLEGLKQAFQDVHGSSVRVVSLPYSSAMDLVEPDEMPAEFNRSLRLFQKWRGGISPELAFTVPSGTHPSIPYWFAWGRAYEQLTPSFTALLHDRQITAWVCVNDGVALIAMDFLKRNGIEVGPSISVVGFDDLSESLEKQLASYNYNLHSCAHAVLMHLLDRSKPAGKVVEVRGYVVDRRSVRNRSRH